MKVESHAVIETSNLSRIIFSEPILYTSPSKGEVKIMNHDKDSNILVVIMNMDVQHRDVATFESERELVRVVSRLSWVHNLAIEKYRITGYQYSETANQTNAVVLATTLHINASISVIKTVGRDGVEKLSTTLSKNYTEELDSLLSKWRDAIRQESSMIRLVLMYQILESLAGRVRSKVEKMIRDKDPHVELRNTGIKNDQVVSVYTYLRDCIHLKPENPQFPFHEVEAHVIPMQELVRKVLKEKFTDLPE
jgi:hypothetical protein